MALREILIWPDARLKQKSKPVPRVDDTVRRLCDDLAETMYENRGVGLAAPQIGVHLDVIAMDVAQRDKDAEDGEGQEEGDPDGQAEVVRPARRAAPRQPRKPGDDLFWLINPKIVLAEGEYCYTEGCLSVPDEYEEVTRHGHIVVEFTGRDGKPDRREADQELLAVCVQHEMDHLQGKLFVDHLSALKRELIRRRMKKLKADREAEAKGTAATL
jgi:peptide deformylase